MTLTSRSVREEVQNYLDYLLGSGLALLAEPAIVRDGCRVTYPNTGGYAAQRNASGWQSYSSAVSGREYSALLVDGSLLQISYVVEGGEIAWHRLSFVPCPFRLDPDLLRTEGVLDLLELADPETDLVMRSPVRFDFDPDAAAPGHPAVHLTFNSADCRIACVAPLRLSHFSELVFGCFYPEVWRGDAYMRTLPRSAPSGGLLTDDEAAGIHLAWR